MKSYSDYKQTDLEWVREIPSAWSSIKMKFILDKVVDNRGRTPPCEEEGIPLLEIKHIAANGKYPSYKTDKYVSQQTFDVWFRDYLDRGDILLGTVGSTGITSIYDAKIQAVIAQNIVGLRTKNYLSDYLYYLLNDFNYKNYQFSLNKNVIQPTLKVSDFIQNVILNPPLEIQKQIVNFLSYKTTLIDSLIAKNQRQIELIEERRQAIINQAITKGLDSKVKMKSSGIEWIGEIPQHWTVKKLRYIGSCINGISKSAAHFGHGNPFVSYGDVYKNRTLPSSVRGLVDSTEEDRNNYSVLSGDILFTRTSETIEEIGYASTCLKTIKDAVFAGFLIRFRPNENYLDKNFSKYYFRSNVHRYFFIKEMNIVTRASLSQDLLKRMPVLLPPIDEQMHIAKYLDTDVSKTSKTLENLVRQNQLLEEYRQALISNTVTGKIDVRDKKIPEEYLAN